MQIGDLVRVLDEAGHGERFLGQILRIHDEITGRDVLTIGLWIEEYGAVFWWDRNHLEVVYEDG